MPAKTRNSSAAEEKEEEVAPAASPIEDKLNSLSAVVDALQAAVEKLKQERG